jgi:hypothetical protein
MAFVEKEQCIGLLVPSSNSTQEPEFVQMLPASVSLHVTRLSLSRIDPDSTVCPRRSAMRGARMRVRMSVPPPREAQSRLNGALRDTLALPEIVASLDKSGLIVLSLGAEAFTAFVRKENERWAAVVKAAGIKAE